MSWCRLRGPSRRAELIAAMSGRAPSVPRDRRRPTRGAPPMSPARASRLPTMTTQTAATFTGISTVAIPVSDQDATKRLFEQLGFETRFDEDVAPDFRWVDMGSPGGGT